MTYVTVASILDRHQASLTDRAENEMSEVIESLINRSSYDLPDFAELAVRYCACGKRIDGFYSYTDHLKKVLAHEGIE